MALLRTSLLWADYLAATNREAVEPLPTLPHERAPGVGPLASKVLYIVPPGMRAVCRTFTAVFNAAPTPGSEPVIYFGLRFTNNVTVWAHWFWFVDHSASIAVWRYATTWTGTLVASENVSFVAASVGAPQISTTGSGALLPIQS